MNVKSVIIDLDGTLLNDDKKVGDKDYQTLVNIGKQNIVRIIATGRSLYSFYQVLNNDFPIDYLIFAAGGGIMNFKTKEIIKSYSIKKDDVIKIVNKLDTLKIDFQIRENIPNGHSYSYKKYSNNNPDFDRLNSLYKSYAHELIDFNSITSSSRIICIHENDSLVNQIEKEFSEFSIIRATSPIDNQSVWMEIYPKGVNKGTAAKYLLNNLEIRLGNAIGIGNDYNDIHFMDIIENSFMVNSAPGDLKRKYSVTVSNNDNPLTEVIKKFSKIYFLTILCLFLF